MIMSTKKSFSEDLNPALAFINVEISDGVKPVFNEELNVSEDNVEIADFEPVREGFAQEQIHKDFEDNPLLLLLHRHQSEETKSRRVQMLLKPSTYAQLKAQASRANISVNAYVNAILEYYIENHSGTGVL